MTPRASAAKLKPAYKNSTAKAANQGTSHPLAQRVAHGFLITRDAIANLRELISENSRMAFLAVKDCERELDRLEREIDEELPQAITGTDEATARELISSLRFVTDLERIGDLVWWVAQCVSEPNPPLPAKQGAQIEAMAKILESMVAQIHEGLIQHDAAAASVVLRVDADMDRLRQTIFREQLSGSRSTLRMDIIMMAQSLERAGDHATNLAEELVHLVEHRSIRHTQKKRS